MRRPAMPARMKAEEVINLATTSPEPAFRERSRWTLVRQIWASLAIAVMWLAVLFDALFGPDLVVSNSSGTTSIPSAVFVALFAYLATRTVAKHGFDRRRDDAG
jgi:hypothetical protein